MGAGRRSLVIVLVALGVLCAGCASEDPPAAQGSGLPSSAPASSSPTASLPPNAIHPSCVEPAEQVGAISFRNSEGVRLVGVMLGEGRTGIALGHQLRGSLCEWMPLARDLAGRGYRVLAIDFGGFGESGSATTGRRTLREDVLAAVQQLRKAGSNRVVLVGSSMVVPRW